nr:PREDICTED: uncharacterized protein LOC107398492 [Tribolium castaneum]|eukprot:XP_015838188.1 PREDICTED: uncharacterized protein LOC107398492 [Tribolium castaneum]
MKLSFVFLLISVFLHSCRTENDNKVSPWKTLLQNNALVNALKPKNDTQAAPSSLTSRLFDTNKPQVLAARPQPFYQKWIVSPIVQFLSIFSKPLAFTFQKIVNVIEDIGRKLWGIVQGFFGKKTSLDTSAQANLELGVSRRKRQLTAATTPNIQNSFSALLQVIKPMKAVLKTILAGVPDFTQRFPTVLVHLENLNGAFDTGFFIIDTAVKYIGFWISRILPKLTFLVDIFMLVWDNIMEFKPWFEKLLTNIITVGKTEKQTYTTTGPKPEVLQKESHSQPEQF